jgi:CheY-like chemotaxis protein
MMPKMDGFETSKLIKEIDNDVIIIALTSIVIEQHSQNFIDAGIKIALTKPINKDELNTNILNQF